MENTGKKIPDEIVRKIHELVNGEKNPNTFMYLLTHGVGAGIPEFDVNMEGVSKEDIYGYCLENKITWEEVLERIPDDVMT